MTRKIPPEVLAELARLAGIVESPPYAEPLVEMVRRAGLPPAETLPKMVRRALVSFTESLSGVSSTLTNIQHFEAEIGGHIEATHFSSAFNNPQRLKRARRVDRLARELTNVLQLDKDYWGLIPLLPTDLDTLIVALNRLTESARSPGKSAKRPGKWREARRKFFIEALLDAAHRAGGEFKLNRRTGGGSLVEAIELLAPYVPAEYSAKTSPTTLRRIKQAWLKRRQNKFLKH
jgi:hypothetical protein